MMCKEKNSMVSGVLQSDYVLKPASGHKAQQLVLLLHGVGANGADLMPLAKSWSTLLPDAEFICPNAPFPYDGLLMENAYQWFSLHDITIENREARVREAAPILNDFIDEQLAQRGLTDSELALVGFSQGTIMSLYLSLRRPHPCSALVGYSGRFPYTQSLSEELVSRPRMFLLHGTQDEVIPIGELDIALLTLKSQHVPVISYVAQGLGHSISAEEVKLGGAFLKYCFENPEATDQQSLEKFNQSLAFPVAQGYLGI
jgi:phospholipase/carboxylesterase